MNSNVNPMDLEFINASRAKYNHINSILKNNENRIWANGRKVTDISFNQATCKTIIAFEKLNGEQNETFLYGDDFMSDNNLQ